MARDRLTAKFSPDPLEFYQADRADKTALTRNADQWDPGLVPGSIGRNIIFYWPERFCDAGPVKKDDHDAQDIHYVIQDYFLPRLEFTALLQSTVDGVAFIRRSNVLFQFSASVCMLSLE